METKYNFIDFDCLSSTNQYLKEHYRELPTKTVISCHYQTNGRGRGNHAWISNDHQNLLMSILLKNDLDVGQYNILSLLAGAALFSTIKNDVLASIKWPNDILVKQRKIAGILLEAIFCHKLEAVIIGIGLNVNQIKFDKSLKATSLKKETAKDFDINTLKKQFIYQFDILYQKYLQGDYQFLEICRNHNYLQGKIIIYNQKNYCVVNIQDNGYLLVSDGKETKEINAGEISISQSCY